MIFRLEREFGLFAENLYYLVVFFFAGKKVVVGHIWQRRHIVGDFFLTFVDSRVAFGDFFADFTHTGENFFYGFTLFFEFGYFCRNLVSFGFQRLCFRHQCLSFGVEFKNFGKICHATLFRKSRLDEFGIFGYKFYIEHNCLLQPL